MFPLSIKPQSVEELSTVSFNEISRISLFVKYLD